MKKSLSIKINKSKLLNCNKLEESLYKYLKRKFDIDENDFIDKTFTLIIEIDKYNLLEKIEILRNKFIETTNLNPKFVLVSSLLKEKLENELGGKINCESKVFEMKIRFSLFMKTDDVFIGG